MNPNIDKDNEAWLEEASVCRIAVPFGSPSQSAFESKSTLNAIKPSPNIVSPISLVGRAPGLSKVVKLDVGGYTFKTSRDTLCRIPDSHLAAMFSGRHATGPLQDDDGSFFIDRDGRHFHHVLNFLRSGSAVTLPEGPAAKAELAVEADFYGLDDLVKAINMPKIDISETVPLGTLKQWEAESQLRAAFVDGTAKQWPDRFRGLLALFPVGDHETTLEMPLKFDPSSELLQDQQNLFMDSLRGDADNTSVSVESLQEFTTNFNKEWPNIHHRLLDVLLQENVVVAGGSVLRALTASEDVRTSKWWGEEKSDIDLFVYGCEPNEASRIARRIFDALALDPEQWVVVRARGVINLVQWVNGLDVKVQIVLRIYDSPTEVLIGFDVDCCCCCYDGRNVWVSPRWISAVRSGVNVLNPLHAWPNKPSYELRLAKYANRGFEVLVPGLHRCPVDYKRIPSSDLADLKGMSRFLKVASEMDSAAPFTGYIYRRDEQTRWRRLRTERPRTPREVPTLKSEYVDNVLSDDERVVHVLNLTYDVDDDHEGHRVLVPSVYGHSGYETSDPWLWIEWGEFPVAGDSRDEAWEEILDGGEDAPKAVPRYLADAWDTGKRSREYMNGQQDKYDLDNLYYSKACKDDAED
ncbi:SH3KBP1-binding protein 1 [Seminavis robusta]|uniref:SH3KBP1-binding protein 1 n=1 Tax=Seminavis robusta TaxID=568900 RepID=A0A9N8H435_9STRA|nr:SH3KBP1-binding protein 1 [Seminavis robusta]|eukprot:Sro40_g024640.1 SH3KBP1-binding protein 1 (636) ;mRNA; r:66764-68850